MDMLLKTVNQPQSSTDRKADDKNNIQLCVQFAEENY